MYERMEVDADLQPKDIVETICNLARKRDKPALKHFLQDYCVGTFNGAYNAVMLLAKQGQRHAVFFLIQEFNASLSHALKGAAETNNRLFIKELLALTSNFNAAAVGAARVKNKNLTDELIKAGALPSVAAFGAGVSANFEFFNQYQSRVVLLEGVKGAMFVGNIDFANQLSKLYLTFLRKNNILTPGNLDDLQVCAACGAAAGGFTLKAKEIIKNNKTTLCNFAEYLSMRVLEHAAFGRHMDLVNYLLNRKVNINAAIRGAAAAGDKKLTLTLIDQGADPEAAAFSAGEEGHFDLILALDNYVTNEQIKSKLIVNALAGAVQGGQLALINHAYIAEHDQQCITNFFATERFSNPESALRLVSLIHQVDFRHYVINKWVKLNVKDKLPFIWLSNNLNELINNYNMNFDEARLYTKLKEERPLFFVVPQVFSHLPPELGLLILSHALKLSENETNKLALVANLRLCDRVVNRYKQSAFSFFRARKNLENFEQIQMKRCQNRIDFISNSMS